MLVTDGKPIPMDLPEGIQAFDIGDGLTALWDGERHVSYPAAEPTAIQPALAMIEAAGRHARGEPVHPGISRAA